MRLDVAGLRVRVGGRLALDGVDLTVAEGRFLGLVGPNGSGKSTLLKTIARVLRPEGGAVLLDGTDVRSSSAREVARSIALVAQEPPTEVEFTVFEMVLLGRLPHQGPLASTSRDDEAIAERSLDRVGAGHLADREWTSLSGGEKQRALLARALAQDTPLLLLDEPTNHLDIGHQLELLALARRLGSTTVAALHDLDLAARYCDDVVVLHQGAVVAAGPAADVLVDDVLAPVFGVHVDVVANPRTGRRQLLFSPLDAASIPDAVDAPLPPRNLPDPILGR